MKNQELRGLTLYQPWATLVVQGIKKFETRSWKTDYRGRLLITSSQKWGPGSFELQNELRDGGVLNYGGMLNIAPLGMALGVVTLEEIYPTDELVLVGEASRRERPLGDFSPGRYAWKLTNPIQFGAHFPIRGKRMLWKVDDRSGVNTVESLRKRGITFKEST